jgi:DNA-binding CsgD family transcriptional regulator
MSTRPMSASSQPDPGDADRVVREVLAGAVEQTRQLLTAASGNDPVLLRVLVLTGLNSGELTRYDGRWRWGSPMSWSHRLARLIGDRAVVLADAQLLALRALTEPWTRTYTVVVTELETRSLAEEAPHTVGLTQRERQILVLLGEGLTAQAIARRLTLSPRTVAKHQERMYRKLGTSDRLTTVLQAQRLGLLRPVVAGE